MPALTALTLGAFAACDDASDTLQSYLPSGSTCPVRYGTGSRVTNENRVFTTFANWKALDGAVSGADANMTFSTNFAFDYDPSNGITTNSYSFQDIIINYTRKCRLTPAKTPGKLPLVDSCSCSCLMTAPDGESRCGSKGKLPKFLSGSLDT